MPKRVRFSFLFELLIRIGGFYTHKEYQGQMSYHVPGFPFKQGFNEVNETEIVNLIKSYAYYLQNRQPPKIQPSAPMLLPCPRTGALIWRGSAWADRYEIWKSNDTINWSLVVMNISDAVDAGQVIWQDPIPGSSFYKIRAFGSSDVPSEFSNVVQG